MSGRTRDLIPALDLNTWGCVEAVRAKLLPLGAGIFPDALDTLDDLRGDRARAALLHTVLKFALSEPDAVALGLKGLGDKSAFLREKAYLLLAVSRQRKTLPTLQTLRDLGDLNIDAAAATAAIEEGDRNLYIDRCRTGEVRLNIGGLIEP